MAFLSEKPHKTTEPRSLWNGALPEAKLLSVVYFSTIILLTLENFGVSMR
jgi:hypothetical protein